MTKVLAPDVFRQHFDNSGDVLNGGLIYTYEAGGSTPTTTWTSSAGSGATGAQANPIQLDSAGREPGGIWITPGTAYKFILKTSAGATLDTVDNIVVGEAASSSSEEIDINISATGTPGAQAIMFSYPANRSFTFPVDFAGSHGVVGTNPGSDYAISVKKNGSVVGTITIASTGVYTFATTGGTTVAFVAGDDLTLVGPASVGTAADFGITLLADIV